MPTYDYICGKGHHTEERQGFGVETISCPICGRKAVRVPVYAEQFIIGETVAKGVARARKVKSPT